jgi:hypothetical protein
MTDALDWSPSKYPPFKHQIEDTATLVQHPWFFIASEMRTGKTKIVIDAAQFLFHAGAIDRVIVVCPEPVRSVWVGATSDALGGELREHLWNKTPALVTEYHSSTNQWRTGPAGKELRIIVTNYEFIRPYRRKNEAKKVDDALKTLLKYCTDKTLLVLDESGAITNHKSEQYKSCYKLREKCGRIVMLNGTPMDTPIHLFAQGNMLHQSLLECKYITHFRNRYAQMGGYKVGATRKVDKKTGKVTWEGGRPTQIIGWCNLDDLQRRFKPYTVRRLQKDCPDMPVRLPAVTLRAHMSTSWSYYKEMRDEMVVMLDGGNASVSSQAIVKFMRLSQITGGFLGGIEDAGLDPPCPSCDGIGCDECEQSGIGAAQPVVSVREVGREKLDVLLWLIGNKLESDPNMKMVVWSRFVPETLRAIREAQLKFPQSIIAGLHGGMSRVEKAATKALLHPTSAPQGSVVVFGTLGTGSFGLDLSAAHISVNYSYDHSLRKFLQSGDRVYGPRQVHAIEYFDIVAVGPKGQRTYDSVIVQARRDKQDIATWTSDAWVKAIDDER